LIRFWFRSSSALVVEENVPRSVNLQNVLKFGKGHHVNGVAQSLQKFHIGSNVTLFDEIEMIAVALIRGEVESVKSVTVREIFSGD